MPSLPLLLTALVASTTPLPSRDDELVALFDRVCLRGEVPGDGFLAVSAADVPADAAGLYIGPHEGSYWRREGPSPAFAARTEGPGHWGGREAYCGVGLAGPSFGDVVMTFIVRLGLKASFAEPHRLGKRERGGNTYLTISGGGGGYSVVVTQRPDEWVSLTTGGVVHDRSPG